MTNNTQEEKHELETTKWDLIGIVGGVNYRGVLVEKIVGGYMVFKKHCVSTPKEVDAIIDLSLESLDKSIKQ